MTTLVVIESPGKRATLEKILGDGYVVLPSFGHIRDLPERDMGVDPVSYRPSYVVPDSATRSVVALRAAAAKASRVLLATDPDREGEAIAWHIAQELRLLHPERITYQEITPTAVQRAITAPRMINMDLVHAQEARRVADRLVGFEVSPRLGDGLSAGRVQSPATRLVVERERAIRDFKVTNHFGATLHFADGWRADWQAPVTEDAPYILDRALAANAAGIKRVKVAAFDDTERRQAPPAPFITSELQHAAQVKLKLKPADTMAIAQALYDAGHITYMRTDAPALSAEGYAMIAEHAQSHGLPLAPQQRNFKSKADAQEAHECIRPTHFDRLDAGDTPQQKALYRLIFDRAVASQLEDAIYAVRSAELVDLVDPELTYRARGQTLVTPGWRSLYIDDDDGEDGEAPTSNPIPALDIGRVLDVQGGEVKAKRTKAPKRYTLATLTKALEAQGIGRPATYSAIQQNIIKRGYIREDDKDQLHATPVGESLIDALIGRFTFVELDFTRALETRLDDIAKGSAAYRDVVAAVHLQLRSELEALPKPTPQHPCPACGAAMRLRKGAKGPFWGCTAYPECTTTLPDVDGAPGARKAAGATGASPPTHTCGDCGKPLRRLTKSKADDPKGKGYDFWSCTGFPTCKTTYKVSENGEPLIPVEAQS